MRVMLTILALLAFSSASLAADVKEEPYTLMYSVPYRDHIEYHEFKSRESCRVAAAIMKGMFVQRLIGGGHKNKKIIRRIVNSRIHCVKS